MISADGIQIEYFGGPMDGVIDTIPENEISPEGLYQVLERIPPQIGDDCWMYLLTDEQIRPDVYRCKIISQGKVIKLGEGYL